MNLPLKCALRLAVYGLAIFGVSTVPSGAQVLVNDNDPSVVYSLSTDNKAKLSNWTYNTNISDDHEMDEHSTNFSRPGPSYQGASVSITFTGTSITWYGKKGPNYGFAVASLETGTSVLFNGFSPTEINRNANATLSAPYGYHVLTIKLLRKTQGDDYFQSVDFFSIVGGGAVPLSAGSAAGYYQWNAGALGFHSLDGACPISNVSHWNCYGYLASDLSGGHFWDGTAGDTISYDFTGSLLEIYGRPDAENGYFTVSIDGRNYGTFDENFSTIDDDSLNAVMIFAAPVKAGRHLATVTVVGRNNGYYSKSGNLVQIDEFVSFDGSRVGGCQYEVAPQGAGQRAVSFSMANSTHQPALFWDAGSNTQLQLYQRFAVQSNLYQDFSWTSVSPGFKICADGGSNLCLSNANGTLKLSTATDIFQVLSNSAILDVTSCSFVQSPRGAVNGTDVTLGATQSPWAFSPVH